MLPVPILGSSSLRLDPERQTFDARNAASLPLAERNRLAVAHAPYRAAQFGMADGVRGDVFFWRRKTAYEIVQVGLVAAIRLEAAKQWLAHGYEHRNRERGKNQPVRPERQTGCESRERGQAECGDADAEQGKVMGDMDLDQHACDP